MSLKLIALDLDGTLTQRRTPLGEQNRRILEQLATRYRLLMVGAGTCERIFAQMNQFPIDIIGNYGMQYARYDADTERLCLIRNERAKVNEAEVRRRAAAIRTRFGLDSFYGDTIEIHPTGMLTFSLVGTQAPIDVKLTCDPERVLRRAMYEFVSDVFFDYHVIIGGSSSFDLLPGDYGKSKALEHFMDENGLSKDEILYIGDDYELGGGDHDVYISEIPFLPAERYDHFDLLVRHLITD